jgi:hypothetical protein
VTGNPAAGYAVFVDKASRDAVRLRKRGKVETAGFCSR